MCTFGTREDRTGKARSEWTSVHKGWNGHRLLYTHVTYGDLTMELWDNKRYWRNHIAGVIIGKYYGHGRQVHTYFIFIIIQLDI